MKSAVPKRLSAALSFLFFTAGAVFIILPLSNISELLPGSMQPAVETVNAVHETLNYLFMEAVYYIPVFFLILAIFMYRGTRQNRTGQNTDKQNGIAYVFLLLSLIPFITMVFLLHVLRGNGEDVISRAFLEILGAEQAPMILLAIFILEMLLMFSAFILVTRADKSVGDHEAVFASKKRFQRDAEHTSPAQGPIQASPYKGKGTAVSGRNAEGDERSSFSQADLTLRFPSVPEVPGLNTFKRKPSDETLQVDENFDEGRKSPNEGDNGQFQDFTDQSYAEGEPPESLESGQSAGKSAEDTEKEDFDKRVANWLSNRELLEKAMRPAGAGSRKTEEKELESNSSGASLEQVERIEWEYSVETDSARKRRQAAETAANEQGADSSDDAANPENQKTENWKQNTDKQNEERWAEESPSSLKKIRSEDPNFQNYPLRGEDDYSREDEYSRESEYSQTDGFTDEFPDEFAEEEDFSEGDTDEIPDEEFFGTHEELNKLTELAEREEDKEHGRKPLNNDKLNNELNNDKLNNDQQEEFSPELTREKKRRNYLFPPEHLLEEYPDISDKDDAYTREAADALMKTFEEFNIEAELIGVQKGPVVTMFEILPAPGVRVSSITNLADNIALQLAASRVRIVAPIPGKQAVGIEVPNRRRKIVSFKEMLKAVDEHPKYEIPMVLGKDITGDYNVIDLVRTPHILIAGATGSGKSVCVNTLITSILYRRSPKDVRLMLIDPKIVELKLYNDIPHLLTPVVTDPKKSIKVLQYCLSEMERRYSLLDAMAVRDIRSYNKKIAEKKMAAEKLPYIVVIIDEFADLMNTTGKELEHYLSRLAAMARAVGIHLVLATQRPSTNVITGLIKANIPSRIAFMVVSNTDSRIIIDMPGAEKLLGKGDMLFMSSWEAYPSRVQGAFLTEEEVEKVVSYVKSVGEPDYLDDSLFEDEEEDENGDYSGDDFEDDPLMAQAIKIIQEQDSASASMLQRRLKIGYNRAARIIETLEEMGIVGPAQGSKPREVLKYTE